MSLERHSPDTLCPAHGYAHAIVATGSRLAFIGGQVATDLAGNVLAVGDYQKQGEMALRNFAFAVDATGAQLSDVAQLNVYIVDNSPERQAQVLAGIGDAASDVGLRRSTMKILGVQSLGDPAALVEFDGIAVLD